MTPFELESDSWTPRREDDGGCFGRRRGGPFDDVRMHAAVSVSSSLSSVASSLSSVSSSSASSSWDAPRALHHVAVISPPLSRGAALIRRRRSTAEDSAHPLLRSHPHALACTAHHEACYAGGGGLFGAGALETLMSDDYVPTQRWPVSFADAALADSLADSLAHLRGSATLNKLRSALRLRYALPRSVKSVPLRAFFAANADRFLLDDARVYLRDYFLHERAVRQ